MPALPTKKELLEMKRPDLQRLCKDYGVKANLKTDALIELLLDTKKANPRTAAPPPPTTRRSVSTRHSSRSAPRISSVVIHDTDEEEDSEEEQGQEPELDQEETENQPEPEPEPIPPPTRTRKAKDTQTRLGVGRPVAAGGNGPRAVTKSLSVAKGKRGKNSKAIKPTEDTIPEEVEDEQKSEEASGSSDLAIAGPATQPDNAPTIPDQVVSASNISVGLGSVVTDALQPVYQQLKALRSELEQLPALKSELAELKKQVADMGKLEQKVVTLTTQMEQMRAQSAAITALGAEFKQFKEADTVAMHSRPNPSTPRLQSPAPSKSRSAAPQSANASSSSKTVNPINTSALPNPGIAPSMLGKRQRESTSSNLTGVFEEGREGELSEEELAKIVVRPTKKRARLLDEEHDEHDFHVHEDPNLQNAPRAPSFTVFSGEEEQYIDPPPPTEGLPDFYAPPSPTGSGGSRHGTTTSTQHASENQHPFTFSFLPISSTPVDSSYTLPNFPYPEAPQSPSPAGPVNGGVARNHGERTDIFQSFGLPPPGRPRSRVTAAASGSGAGSSQDNDSGFVNPASITRRTSDKERDDVAAGFGFMRAPSDNDEPPVLKRTMYGTELDGDSRFGDFGVEGVASTGFWAGAGRF